MPEAQQRGGRVTLALGGADTPERSQGVCREPLPCPPRVHWARPGIPGAGLHEASCSLAWPARGLDCTRPARGLHKACTRPAWGLHEA